MNSRISVRAGGKLYSMCSVEEVGEWKIRVVCSERKRFWRSLQISFERSSWELSSRSGASVYLGDLELVFHSEDDACGFIAKTLSTTYGRALEEAKEAAASYLKRRSRVLETLSRLRRTPRSVLISEASSLKGCRGEPLDCLLERLRGEVVSTYGEFAEQFERAISQLPTAEAERVRSAVYLAASLQSKIYEGDVASIYKILDLVETEHGYSADRIAIEKIAYRHEAKGVEDLCIEMLNTLIKRISTAVYLKYRCTGT